MIRSWRVRLGAVLAVLGMAVVACGTGGGTPEVGGITASPNGEVTAGQVGAIVDDVVLGTSGFRIDLGACPSDWSNTLGVTDAEVRLGTSFVQSGTLAPFGLIVEGERSFFEYTNTEGGVGGREIVFEVKDDAYEPARTVANIDELLEAEEIFAIVSPAGTPNNLAVYDRLNEECVPHLHAATGHPAWGDPNFHPWTVGSFLSYNTEAQLWGQYLLDRIAEGALDPPARVALLVMNNDFGHAYRDAFRDFAESSDGRIEIVAEELHDPKAPTVSNELTTLAASKANVAIAMTTSVFCTQVFEGVAQAAWDPSVKLFSNTCAGIESYFLPAGSTGVGWRHLSYSKDLSDPQFEDDSAIRLARSQLEATGRDPSKSQYGNGWAYAWATVEVLRQADVLPGGLTRTNTMVAARSMDWANPMYLDGVAWRTDGAVDAYPTEAAEMREYRVGDGAELGSHVSVSEVISVEGSSGLCHYDGNVCHDE